MPPETPSPRDRITANIVKGCFCLYAGVIFAVVADLQLTIWKCGRTARRLGYLQGEYIPPNRQGAGEECICRQKRRADGTVDSADKLVIDLDHNRLGW